MESVDDIFEPSGLDCFEISLNLFLVPVPPAQLQQFADGFIVETLANRLSGNAADNRVRRNIFGYYGATSDNRTIADGYTRKDESLVSNPDIVSDCNITLVIPCPCNGVHICRKPPLFKEDWEWVSRKTSECMICGVK